MKEKSIDQFLFEYDIYKMDTHSTDDSELGSSVGSFGSMKDNLGSYSRMMAILAGEEKFEYSLLENPKMVRALVDNVSKMVQYKDKLADESKSVAQRIKELEKIEYKTLKETDELDALLNKNKAYQLQKTLIRFGPKLKEIDDILTRIENGVDVTDKTIKKYESFVSEIEDAIFNETYVRRNLAYDKGEASGGMKKPTATDNFPIKFISTSGKTYYGIIRPPSGIITWEGREAREAWLTDSQIKEVAIFVAKSKKHTKDEILKIRISKDDFKVLEKEQLNNKLLGLRMPNGTRKIEINDSDSAKDAIRSYIFNELEGGIEREVTDYSTMNDGSIEAVLAGAKTKRVQPALDNQDRPKDLTNIIDSIEFWRFIRGLF